MKKEDLTVPAIFAEAIGMILGIVYIGLQIYYGIAYKVAPYKFICNIAGVVSLVLGFSLFRLGTKWRDQKAARLMAAPDHDDHFEAAE